MEEALEKWNRWGTNLLDSGIPRTILEQIKPFIKRSEVIVLKGPRRAGKSTVLYQIMDFLEDAGIPQEAMLHINFEEPKLSPYLNTELLDSLYDWYREHIFPEGKAYIFLDEIQNVPDWERWVRARNKTENIKIFITGSSAKLMSKEIATILTGRHISFEIMPLSFREYLSFQKIAPPKHLRPVAPTPTIKKAINQYQKWGGFPAIILEEIEQIQSELLAEYFDDILFKDVAIRHGIRDLQLLRNIAIHLLTQTGKLVSFQRIANVFNVSNDAAGSYCRYLEECYMVSFLPYYSLKASIRQRHPHKVYAIDLGLRNTVSFAHSEDEGRLVETLVYQTLKRKFGDQIFYWKGTNEIDFVIKEGNKITHVWQVCSENLEDDKVWTRETRAIEEAKEHFPEAECHLVAKALPKKKNNNKIKITPLWNILSA